MNLCIIPARAGSKRIIHKNTKDFLGQPIIEYPLMSAIKSKLFEKIIILTDDRKIMTDYSEYAFHRDPKTANDSATLSDLLKSLDPDFISQYDYICLLLPTAVFTTDLDLRASYYSINGHDALTTLTRFNHPIQRAFKLKNTKTELLDKKNEFISTQDLETFYFDAGQFYWIKIKSFLKQQKIFMKNLGYYIIKDAVDIDTIEDWELAEIFYNRRFNNGNL